MDGLSGGRGDAALLAAAPDGHTIDADAPITLVDKHRLWFLSGENAHLFDGFRPREAVVGIARQTAHADHQTFLVRGGDGDLDAKFVRLTHLSFGNALNLGGVQAIELVFVFGLLFQ